MSFVIKLVCSADGRKSKFDGMYLRTFTPAHGGHLEVTEHIGRAKSFVQPGAAFEFWKMETGRIRPDGKPDRPLTAWTVEITQGPDA